MKAEDKKIIKEATRRATAEGRGLAETVFDVALYHRYDEDEAAELTHKVEISTAAAILGQRGGRAKSPRKAETSRENGKKGGRPRKDKS